ncbi:MAG: DUF1565 domain-containing protein [Cyanobacteria bacterium P01_F01_bin.33]
MKRWALMQSAGRVVAALSVATLTSCGLFERWQSGDLNTDRVAGRDVPCEAAIARRTQRWQVRYVIDRTTRDTQPADRVVTFASRTLVTQNGQPSAEAEAIQLDGDWWPSMPPRPDFQEIEGVRRSLERADMPRIDRQAEFFLACDAGELSASERVYRKALTALQQGQTVRATHGLGRVANIQVLGTVTGAKPEPQTSLQPQANRTTSDRTAPTPTRPKLWHVDGAAGRDSNDGSLTAPLATISRALAAAQYGDTVRIAPGTYTEESGEIFPLEVGGGVTLAGNAEGRGDSVIVRGGGKYVSPSWMRQNIAIVAKDNARVAGLTVSNPNLRGTGVWIEVGTVEIHRNTFADNHREGVFVAGDAAPDIRDNVFVNNGGNGASYTRNSGGTFASNIVRSSGYGVAIGDMASPLLSANDIRDNQYGLVISGQARPNLQDNAIANSTRDGIVVTNSARPNLQGNAIANSGQSDLNNNTGAPLDVDSVATAEQSPAESDR